MTFKVALLQLLPCGSDETRNLVKGVDYCRRAQAVGADLVVFPELWNIGCALRASPAEQHRWNSAAIDQQSHFFRGFVSAARDLEVNIALTYLSSAQPRPRNTVAILNRSGEVVLTYSKVCICDFEPDDGEEVGCDVNCAPGNSFPVCTLTARDGDRVHVGAMICADREFPEPASRLMRNGAELIIVPNACDWDDVRSSGLLTRAVENLVVVAMANYPRPKANGNSRAYSCVTWKGGGPENPLIAVAGEQEELLIAEFDLAEIRAFRKAEAWRLKHRSQLDSQRETVRPEWQSYAITRGTRITHQLSALTIKPPMNAQLVLQFDAASTADFDRLVSFEELLRQQLDARAIVDGHDFGSAEFNIFILSDDPRLVFGRVAEIAQKLGLISAMRAGWRAIEADEYTALWPPGSPSFSVA